MPEHHISTPFGGGRFSARLALHQQAVARQQAELKAGAGGNRTGRADKWALIDALTEARFHFGLNDRAIAVLEALLSFVPGREIDGAEPLIVFPSNRALSARLRGMSAPTIRRHLASLAGLGLLIRRDSPNGKRYRVKAAPGEAEECFGFDLAPLALEAEAILAAADQARALFRQEKALRTQITLEQRDIGRIVATALEEGRPGDWDAFAIRLASLVARIRRRDALDDLKGRLEALILLRAEVEKAYLSALSDEELSTSDRHFERHIQNSNTDPSFELNGKEVIGRENSGDGERPDEETTAPERKGLSLSGRGGGISLKRVLKACPALSDYASGGEIRSLEEFLKVAGLVRSMLGISPDAWAKAETALGREQAACVMAMMLERAETIRSPGGYLRSLTAKAENGQFSILPMLKALEQG